MRAASWLVLLVALSVVLGACGGDDAAPQLVQVTDVSPRDVALGDQLELSGAGFPAGKPATVEFFGDLHRPGSRPRRGVRIVAKGASLSASRVRLTLTSELESAFCGRGDEARHTTFHGEVTVSFAPKLSGAPPVSGRLRDATLDIDSPTVAREVLAERRAEAEHALTFLGLELDADVVGRVLVKSVVPGGRASRAGLEPGDALISFDGTSVLSADDLVSSGEHRFAEVLVRRGAARDALLRRVEVEGMRERAPGDLATAAILVGLAGGLLLLFMSPTAGLLTWIERRLVLRLRSTRARAGRADAVKSALRAAVSEDLLPPGIDRPLLRVLPYVVFVATSAAFTALALGRALILPDLDLGILLLSTITALTAAGLVLGGWRRGRRWSLLDGAGGALSILSYQLPLLIGVMCVVLMTGSLRIEDIVAAQGGAPWRWNVFQSPVLLLAFMLVTVAALPEASRAPLELPEADGETPGVVSHHAGMRAVVFLAEWGAAFIVAGVAAALFLGGWRLPGVSWNLQRSSAPLIGLGALLFQVKCWLLLLGTLALRWALPRVRLEQMAAVCWRYLVPLSLVALLSTVLWLIAAHSPVLRALEGASGYVLFALCLIVLAWFTRRVMIALRDPQAQMNVNPWL